MSPCALSLSLESHPPSLPVCPLHQTESSAELRCLLFPTSRSTRGRNTVAHQDPLLDHDNELSNESQLVRCAAKTLSNFSFAVRMEAGITITCHFPQRSWNWRLMTEVPRITNM